MIFKLLLIVGVVYVIYTFFLKEKNKKIKSDNKNAHDMVECKSCGVYCELEDAIIKNGQYYCSKECLK